jgi:hypothetical protein
MVNVVEKHGHGNVFDVNKKADSQLAYWYNSIVRLDTADGRPDALDSCNYLSLDVINFSGHFHPLLGTVLLRSTILLM